MTESLSRLQIEKRESHLSPYAARSKDGIRNRTDPPCPVRNEFQRDRDRIIHSKSFRRLKHKTQVFIAPIGDHYVTRLPHTLEVAQIARTITRALNLNEDLSEAISLGHDLGHTPFGHVGEAVLDNLYPNGFRHADQSIRIVESIEKEGKGLNLTQQVRQGIANHSKPQGDFFGNKMPASLSLEGQICRVSDAIAYLNHDLGDAFRAEVLSISDLPKSTLDVLGPKHSQRINTMVTDIVIASWDATGEKGFSSNQIPRIQMGKKVRLALNELREFMFEKIYMVEDKSEESETARRVITLLNEYFTRNRDLIPSEYKDSSKVVVDYISGMTDHYALEVAEKIEPGVTGIFRNKIGMRR